MHQPGEVMRGGLRGHVECLQGQRLRGEPAGDIPTDDLATERVGHEGHVGEPRPRCYERDIRDPQPVRGISGESTAHQVREKARGFENWRGHDRFTASDRPSQTCFAHQASHLVAANFPDRAAHRGVHLAHPIDRIVRSVNAGEFLHQQLITKAPG